MIALVEVAKAYGSGRGAHVILDGANLRIDPRERVGILAPSGSGKTTIARLLAGIEAPDRGAVLRRMSLSWPLGFSSAFHPALSPAENVALVADLHHLDPEDLVLRAEAFAELGAGYRRPLGALSPGQRNQLGMAVSLSVDFDMYLADEFSAVGNTAFQDKIEAALEARMTRAGLVLLTRHAHTIRRLATRFVALAGARFIECRSADEAADVLKLAEEEAGSTHVAA